MIRIDDYDNKNDILYINYGGKVEGSIEMFEGRLILDVNKEGKIVGFEIYNFKKELKDSTKRMNQILNIVDKKLK